MQLEILPSQILLFDLLLRFERLWHVVHLDLLAPESFFFCLYRSPPRVSCHVLPSL